MIYFLILPLIVFGVVGDHTTLLNGALWGLALLALEIAVAAALLRFKKTPPPSTAPDAGTAAVAANPRARAGLQFEPSVCEMSGIELVADITIASAQTGLLAAATSNHALIAGYLRNDEAVANLFRLPLDALLPAFPAGLHALPLSVSLRYGDGATLVSAYGCYAEIERTLLSLLHATANQLVQERGEFIDGKFFTSDTVLHIVRDQMEDRGLTIAAISRAGLTAAIQRELSRLRAHLALDGPRADIAS
ncbi:hypothetical protein [Amantichitinum ursilacus]|uniref:Uncharacterized protein n=1 Tax=Amantichitinum ursilacus TaxID=857265 RepID=A0A0N0GQW6_9NEIS|nr:hypothetical protein [Amantichitinum ursilacus]KPC54831.1 hypothetical protein WG78_04640 [Amantichitinum ursilacus]